MKLTLDVDLPTDGWEGNPAAQAAQVTAEITALLLRNQHNVGCDLSGATGVYIDGERVGEWGLYL